MLLSSYLQISVGWPFLSCYHEVSLLQGTPRLLTWPGIMAQCRLGRPHPHAETAVKLWLLHPHPARCSVPGKAVTALDWGPCQPWRRGQVEFQAPGFGLSQPKTSLGWIVLMCVPNFTNEKCVCEVLDFEKARSGRLGCQKGRFLVFKDRLALNMLS